MKPTRDKEADARIKFAGMPFDFGDHTARLHTSRLIDEIGRERNALRSTVVRLGA